MAHPDLIVAATPSFAVRNGRFILVGSQDDVVHLRGPKTTMLDLRGKFILPGLIDAHTHLTGVGLDLQCADLIGATSFDETVVRMREFARASGDEWLFGNGWDQNLWPGKAWPDHRLLSAAIPNRPAVLRRIDTHAILVNDAAMRRAGIHAGLRDPEGGRILRFDDGTPNGVFVDNAMRLINAHMPQPTRDQLVRAISAAVRRCNSYGITTVAEAGTPRDFLRAQIEAIGTGAFTLRNYAMLPDDAALLAEYFDKGTTVDSLGGHLWIRAVKIFADGALGSRGAALFEPYCDDHSTSGFMTVSQEHVQTVTEAALHAGFQVCTHAIGDRTNHMVLDAYEAALAKVPTRDHRLRIEHAQVIAPEDVPRFAKLGVIPSMQSCHHLSEIDWAESRLGGARMPRAYPFRQLIDSGSIIANGTDAPVEPLDPRRTFYSAITARGRAMKREEALKSMTVWPAYANFMEQSVGSIAVGKYADFIVLDRDWMTCEPEAILETKVLATYMNGERVYSQ